MNSSVYSADRATYLRIVTVALLASMAIVGFAISVRTSDERSAPAMTTGSSWKAEVPNRDAAVAPLSPQRNPPDPIRLAALTSWRCQQR
jgi:hypothetical protein